MQWSDGVVQSTSTADWAVETLLAGHIDVAWNTPLAHVRVQHLPLVVGEEREVEGHARVAEVLADAFPDGDDLGVVGDGAEQHRAIRRAAGR
jgi:hypothetical protein